VTYGYRVRERDESGFCASEYSACVTGSTTGPCSAPPLFAGLQSATNGADPSCRVELAWAGADPLCGESVTYNVYRGSDELFLPEAANRIASGVVGHGYFDLGAPSGVTSHYIVRAVDPGSLAEESNLARHSTAATGPPVDGTFTTGAEIGEPPLDTIAPPAGSPEAPEHAGWHPTETRKHTGLRSFGSGAAASACITLEGDFDLTAGQSSQLSFWHFYVTEPGYDGGILQLSTNGGGNWTQLTPSGGYPSSITQSGNACAALTPGTPAFVGSTPAWGQRFVSLAPWAGQSVRIAWRYGTDTAVTEEGWYVDDIALTHTQVPSSCENNGLFLDGFESEDTSAWSATVPPLP
jgi:hypothetical protein